MPASLKQDAAIRITANGGSEPTGRLAKIYPQIENGRVIADVEVDELDTAFVDARVLVEVPVGERQALLVPAGAVATRSGIDFVTVAADGATVERAVVLGEHVDARRRRIVEVLTGLAAGDVVVDAMKPSHSGLGIAGSLTRAFIASPLTPLFLLAAFAFGLVALMTLPREEEPQISVPMVDILVRADGLKAEDAVKLVTEPLETIVKGIDGVEHVYSQTRDDQVMVTARFMVGTSSDAAVLRVHDKVRANMDRIPVGIPEPLIVGRGIDDVAIVSLTLSPEARGGRPHQRQRPDPHRPRTAHRDRQDRQCRPDLSGRRDRRDDPHRARSRTSWRFMA